MPSNTFKATEGLLSDVMRKQSGVIEKAWLEALMNGVDANASKIEFQIDSNTTRYDDDGDSMTESQIQKYFEYFGLKDDDIADKEFGKFRMGRGQIFNFGVNIWRARENYMVVSLDDDQVEVELPDCTDSDDETIIDHEGDTYTVNTKGLSYALLSADEVDSGISIEVEHYNEIGDLDSTLSEFRKLAGHVSWAHDVEVVINGDNIYNEPELIDETKLAYYCKGYSDYRSRSPVYNKGAYVDDFKLGPVSVSIITKVDLDVTLDRTDILEHDENWKSIKSQYDEVVISHLIDKVDMTTSQRNWMLDKAADSATVLQHVADVPLIEDVNNNVYTIQEVSNNQISFADVDDEIAKDVMKKSDVIMLNKDYEESFKGLASSVHERVIQSDVRKYSEVIDEEVQFEMDEIPDSKLSTRRLSNIEQIRSAVSDLGFNVEVKAGYSNHKDIWKTEEEDIFIHKDQLNCKKQYLATHLIQRVAVVASHDGETMTSFNESYGLNRNLYKAIEGKAFGSNNDYATVQNKLLNGDYK